MRSRCGTQLSLVERSPLATSSQHREDGIGAPSIWYTWAAATKAMGVHPRGQQWLQYDPQVIGNTEAGGRRVVWGPSARALRRCLCTHTP